MKTKAESRLGRTDEQAGEGGKIPNHLTRGAPMQSHSEPDNLKGQPTHTAKLMRDRREWPGRHPIQRILRD